MMFAQSAPGTGPRVELALAIAGNNVRGTMLRYHPFDS